MRHKDISIRQLPDKYDRYINILAKNIDGKRADAIEILVELTEYVKNNKPSLYTETIKKYLDRSSKIKDLKVL